MADTTFQVSFPLHELAANCKDDIVATLRSVANKIDAKTEEGAFDEFALDPTSVDSLSYVSYGVYRERGQ